MAVHGDVDGLVRRAIVHHGLRLPPARAPECSTFEGCLQAGPAPGSCYDGRSITWRRKKKTRGGACARRLIVAAGGGEWDDAHSDRRRDDLRRLGPRALRGRGPGARQPHRQGGGRRLPQQHGGGPGHRRRRCHPDAGPRQLPRASDLPQHGRGLLRDRRAPGGGARLPHHAQREGDAGCGLHRHGQRLVREGPARHRDPQRDRRRRHPRPPHARGDAGDHGDRRPRRPAAVPPAPRGLRGGLRRAGGDPPILPPDDPRGRGQPSS